MHRCKLGFGWEGFEGSLRLKADTDTAAGMATLLQAL